MPPRFAGIPVDPVAAPAPANKPRFAGVPVQPQRAAPRSQGNAVAPEGMRPGTPEYATWAAEQARAGKVLPQISDPDPGWQAPGVLAPVQFQQGTGNMRMAMPSIVTDTLSAMAAPGKALQGEYDAPNVNVETGAVDPFNIQMMDDAAALASNVVPASAAARLAAPTAKLGSEAARLTVVGPTSAVPSIVPKVVKNALPEIDDLYAAKDAAYKAVDQLGARYSVEAYEDLTADMIKRAAEGSISDTRHPKAYSMLVDLQSNPRAMTLTELDQLRQVIRRDLVNGGDDAEGHFGQEFIDAIDDFIEKAGPSQMTASTPQAASQTIKAARLANRTLRKSETIEKAVKNAELRTASTGSGGNIDNATRQELAKIIKSEKLSRGFSKAELAMIETVVKGDGKLQEVLRLIGKLSPSGNGLMAALGLIATATNPLLAAAPLAGLGGRVLSDRATRKGFENVRKTVRTGGGAAPVIPKVTSAPRLPSAVTPKASTTLIEQNVQRLLPTVPSGIIRLET